MSFSFLDPWHSFLPREGEHVVALSGSGGKTTLMLEFARILGAEGVPLILTTTTRSERLDGVDEMTVEAAGAGEEPPPTVFVHAGVDDEGKRRGVETTDVDAMGGWAPLRVVLVEADGAARQRLKIPRDGEPVWPGRTSLAVVVMGAGAVGEKAGGAVHRLGAPHMPSLAAVGADTIWEWDHQLELLLGAGGYLSRVPEDVPAVLALTGIDDQPDSIGLFEFVGRAMEDPRLPLVLFVGRGEDGLTVRAACRTDDDD